MTVHDVAIGSRWKTTGKIEMKVKRGRRCLSAVVVECLELRAASAIITAVHP